MFNYARYLEAKESIDLQSVNAAVWTAFVDAMPCVETRPVRIAEVGGGIGTLLKRIADAPKCRHTAYTLIEVEQQNVTYFSAHIAGWMQRRGFTKQPDSGEPGVWQNDRGQTIAVHVLHRDVRDVIDTHRAGDSWDVLIGQAFLDLFDLEVFIPRLLQLIRPGGLFYFPINFDGITSFLPTQDPEIDALVERIYHESMDARAANPGLRGRSQSGRHLLSVLSRLEVDLIAAGGSDWVVHARQGAYAADARFFLSQILDFVAGELEKSNEIPPKIAASWLEMRQQQLEEGALIYLAHQIDVLGRKL